MAVGQPETNLDTWGLRYVKKISGSKTPSTKPTESTSAGNRISDADVKTPDAIETRREGSESGTVRTTGATEGSDKKRQFAHGKEVPVGSKTGIEVDARSKLTARGDKKFTEAGGIHSGSEASNVSGIQSQTQQTVSEKNPHGVNRFGTPNKKNPEDRKARARGALPKAKAEMELAIIKCKLLKMNDISKKGEWDHLPHAQKEKEREEKEDEKVEKRNVDDEKYQQGNPNYNSPHSEAGIQSGEIKPHPNPVKGEHTEDTKYFSQTGEELGRGKEGKKLMESDSKKKNSDEIVEKAIELINEAYGEMKKDAPASTGTVGAANFVYSDVKEAEKQKQ